MNELDPILLQRLVDGELELDQLRELLSTADSNPACWKEMATAMVEDRLWQSSVRESMSNTELPPDLATETLDVRPPSITTDLPKRNNGSGNGSRFTTMFWIAASIFLASVLGYMLGGYANPVNYLATGPDNPGVDRSKIAGPAEDSAARLAQVVPQTEADTQSPQITPAVYEPDYHLELPDSGRWMNVADAGPLDPVPLYEIGNRDQLRQFQQQQNQSVSPELVQRFIDAGYDMQQEIEFISGSMEQDQRFIVPVRTIRFVPRQ